MKRTIVVMALVFLFAGCPLFMQPQDGFCADPIIVGVPTSLYTPFGSYGLKAVNLAVEEINAKGGVNVGGQKRPLKVVVADTRDGEPTTPVHDALMAYEKTAAAFIRSEGGSPGGNPVPGRGVQAR